MQRNNSPYSRATIPVQLAWLFILISASSVKNSNRAMKNCILDYGQSEIDVFHESNKMRRMQM